MEAQGRAGADIPEPSGQHSAMFGGTKKKPKYHAPIKQVMQRLLADNPDEIAQMLDMPHLGEYAKQLAVHLRSLNRAHFGYADHYCHIKKNPYWIKGEKTITVIKNHKFYKLR